MSQIVTALILLLLTNNIQTSELQLIALQNSLRKLAAIGVNSKSLTESQKRSLQQMASKIDEKIKEFSDKYEVIVYGYNRFKTLDRSQWAGMLSWLQSAQALKKEYYSIKEQLPDDLYNIYRSERYSQDDLALVDTIENELFFKLMVESLKEAIRDDLKLQHESYLQGAWTLPRDLPTTKRNIERLKEAKAAILSYILNLLNTEEADPAQLEKMIQASDPVYRDSLLALFKSYKDNLILNELERQKAQFTTKLTTDLEKTYKKLASYEKLLATTQNVMRDVAAPTMLAMQELYTQHKYLPDPKLGIKERAAAVREFDGEPFSKKLVFLYNLFDTINQEAQKKLQKPSASSSGAQFSAQDAQSLTQDIDAAQTQLEKYAALFGKVRNTQNEILIPSMLAVMSLQKKYKFLPIPNDAKTDLAKLKKFERESFYAKLISLYELLHEISRKGEEKPKKPSAPPSVSAFSVTYDNKVYSLEEACAFLNELDPEENRKLDIKVLMQAKRSGEIAKAKRSGALNKTERSDELDKQCSLLRKKYKLGLARKYHPNNIQRELVGSGRYNIDTDAARAALATSKEMVEAEATWKKTITLLNALGKYIDCEEAIVSTGSTGE